MAWITKRPPTDGDTHAPADECVEVTYLNGLLGWEKASILREWKVGDFMVVAWRKIRPAYQPRVK